MIGNLERIGKQVDLSEPLLYFSSNDTDAWTVDDAIKGTSIIGGTGSGKTSGSGRELALAFLKQGWGGVVLCAKTDEADLWWEYCKEAKRSDDLIMFYRGAKLDNGEYMVFNPVDYEMQRDGDGARETQNLTNIFMNMYKMSNKVSGGDESKGDERYWDTALKRCLNRTIELLKLAKEELSYTNMVNVLSTISTNADDKLFDYRKSIKDASGDYVMLQEVTDSIKAELEDPDLYCLKCLFYADYYVEMCQDNDEKNDNKKALGLVYDYFCRMIPRLDPKTVSIITESFMGLAEPFLSGLLSKHFSGRTNIYPEWTFTDKKIIVVDFSVKEYLDAGVVAQSAFKYSFQQAIERRNIKQNPMPVFFWCDEAQYFINDYDQLFLTTARSSRTATVYLSQNISNYLAKLSGPSANALVDSLMGNLCTKIFHANTDATTNEYASRLIGETLGTLETSSEANASFSLITNFTRGRNSGYLKQVQPMEFTTLKTGGNLNKRVVQAVVLVSGKKWANKKNFIKTSFIQKLKST